MNEKGNQNIENFLGFVQLFSRKMLTALKSTMLVAYLFHTILSECVL